MLKRKRKLKSKWRFAVFIVVMVFLFAAGFAAAGKLWPLLLGPESAGDMDEEVDEQLAKLPGMNVLMMGVDEREGDKSLRTDTMILANINNKDNRISLLSIPRDTKVVLPGYGVNKINAANLYGGPEMAMDVVSSLTGVTVDYYIITNFNGFKDIVDALGGVTVDVEKDMYYHERAYGGKYDINLKKGVQRLNGEQALMYARYRRDELGDISRTQRQLKLLTAIGEEVMQPSTIAKLPKLIPGIYKNVKTNMGLKQLVAMARAAKNLENIQIVTQTLPGWFLDENGASYWYVDPDNARQVTMALFEEGRVVEVVRGAMVNNDGKKQVAMKEPEKQPEAAPVNVAPVNEPAGAAENPGPGEGEIPVDEQEQGQTGESPNADTPDNQDATGEQAEPEQEPGYIPRDFQDQYPGYDIQYDTSPSGSGQQVRIIIR